jgi:hypothetical protein
VQRRFSLLYTIFFPLIHAIIEAESIFVHMMSLSFVTETLGLFFSTLSAFCFASPIIFQTDREIASMASTVVGGNEDLKKSFAKSRDYGIFGTIALVMGVIFQSLSLWLQLVGM